MGHYADDLDDEAVEMKAVELCEEAGASDAFAMTYINDDGIPQPYGPAWSWYVEAAVDLLRAAR